MHAMSHPSQVVNCVEIYIDQLVEGHLWKAQWKEKPNDEGHRKLTMNS